MLKVHFYTRCKIRMMIFKKFIFFRIRKQKSFIGILNRYLKVLKFRGINRYLEYFPVHLYYTLRAICSFVFWPFIAFLRDEILFFSHTEHFNVLFIGL